MAVFDTDEEAQIQYKRLRRKTGATIDVISDTLAEEYFVEAQELYPNDTAKMKAQAVVIALTSIRASAAMLGKYAQNEHEEDLTKVFNNLSDMLDDAYKAVLVAADPVSEDETFAPFFFGKAIGRRGL